MSLHTSRGTEEDFKRSPLKISAGEPFMKAVVSKARTSSMLSRFAFTPYNRKECVRSEGVSTRWGGRGQEGMKEIFTHERIAPSIPTYANNRSYQLLLKKPTLCLFDFKTNQQTYIHSHSHTIIDAYGNIYILMHTFQVSSSCVVAMRAPRACAATRLLS